MVDRFFVVLTTLVVSTAAGPLSDSPVTQCAVTCPESSNSKFAYEPGKTYEYGYESDIKTSVPGATEHSSLHMRATVNIDVISTCEMVLRLSDVSLQDSDPARYESRQHVRDVAKFRNALQDKPMSFSFVDGEIQSVCPRSDDEPWAANVRRAVLSTLQNTMTSLQGVREARETDVSGDCPVKYEVTSSSSWGHTIKVKKTKDLLGCTDRHSAQTVFQGTAYLIASDIQSMPLLKSTHVCSQEINSKTKLITSSSCKESHAFRPFAKAASGATTDITYKLTFKRQSDTNQRQDGADRVRSTLLYDHTLSADQQSGAARDAQQTITQICSQLQVDVRPNTPGLFTDLVRQLRRLNTASLRQVLQTSKSATCTKAETIFRDALPALGTTAAVVMMRDLINNGQATDAETDIWLTSIAFLKNPTKDMMKELKPLLQNNMAKAALPVSSLINTYCQAYSTEQASQDILQMVKLFEDQLNYNCRIDTTEQTTTVLTALRALGNAGSATATVTPTLARCVANDNIPTVVRVAAINAYRRVSCSENNRDELFQLVENRQLDSELRIHAYLAVMQCASDLTMIRVQTVLESEEVNQVGSFIWSHLTNLQETASPLKKDIRVILENTQLKKEFDIDKRKFSRNIELSTFSELLNVGITTESNLIWSTSSFVPRSASLNLTVDLFGQSINLLELGGRVQGVEDLLERFLGPNRDNVIRNREPRAIIRDDVFNTIDRKFSKTPDNDLFSYYVRVFGNEIRAGDVFDFDLDALKGRLNYLDWLLQLAQQHNVDFSKSFHFLDASISIPTGTGFPVRLAAEGTATVSLSATGKVDIRQMMSSPSNIDISGSVKPSAALEVRGEMGVDAVYAKTGLRMVNTLHTSTVLDGLLQLKDGRVFNFDLNMPTNKMEIFSAESHLFVVYRDQSREQLATASDVWQWQRCTSDVAARTTGLKLCAEASLPWGKDVKFPMIGAAVAKVYLDKVETYRGAHFEASYTPAALATDGADAVRISFNTPGSTTDRELTANFKLDQPQRKIHMDLKTPWKKLSVDGGLVNRQDLKQASIKAIIDDQDEYSVNAEIGIDTRGNSEFRLTPKLEIVIPSRPTVLFNGTLNYIKGRRAEVKLALRNVATNPITIDGAMTVTEKTTSTKYDVNLQIGSPILRALLTGYTANSHDSGNSWASRAELKYSYRSGKQERILVTHKVRDQSTNNLRFYSMDGSWTSTLAPRFNGQTGLELSFSPNSLRTKIEAGFDDQRKVSIITSGAFDFSGRDKKLNGLIKVDVPFQGVSVELKTDHINNWDMLQTNATIKYDRNRHPFQASFDLGLKKDSEHPLRVSGEAKIKYPTREIIVTHSLTERAPREYANQLTVQTQRGYQIGLASTYKMGVRHEVTNTLTVPDMPPVTLNGHLSPDLFNMQARAELGLRGKTYHIDSSWTHRGPANSFNTRASLELNYAGRVYSGSGEVSRRQEEITGNAEISLKGDRYTLSTQVTANPLTPRFQIRAEMPNDRQFVMLAGSGKYEHRGWLSTTNDLEGSIKLTSSIPGAQELGASFVHDQSANNFKTTGELVLSPVKKITGEMTADRSKATLSLNTPYQGFRTIRAESTYSATRLSGQLTGKLQWERNQMQLQMSGDVNDPSRLITGRMSFSSPFQGFENIGANFRHTINNERHQTSGDFNWAAGKRITLTSAMNHRLNGLELTNSGEMTINTPFPGYRTNKLRWSHENTATSFKCNHEIELEQGRRFSVAADVSHTLTRQSRQVKATASFQCPVLVDWLQPASISVDYQHDLRAWKSTGKSAAKWGRYEFGYEHDVNIVPYQAAIIKAKVTTPFDRYRQMGIALNNRKTGNQWSANNELLMGAVGKATLDGALSYNGPIFDASLRLTTPINRFERFAVSAKNTRQNDGSWNTHADLQYAPDKLMAIDSKFSASTPRRLFELEISSPFDYMRQMKFTTGCSGSWRSLQANAELSHNAMSDKMAVTLTTNLNDVNNLNAQFSIQTPFSQFTGFKVNAGHVRDSREHMRSTASWELNRYRGSALADINMRGATDFNGRFELEYQPSQKLELSGSVKLDPKVVVTAAFKSPFEAARQITFTFNEEGPIDNFKIKSEVVYARNKKIATQLEFTLQEDSLRTMFLLTTPFSSVQRAASTVSLTGALTRFNLDSSFELNGQKVTKTMSFSLVDTRLTLSGQLQTPSRQIRQLSYSLNHDGSWRDFTTTSSLNYDGQEITASAKFKVAQPSGRFELRTPYDQVRSFVAAFSHTNKPGRSFTGWTNQGSIELNDQKYTAESSLDWQQREVKMYAGVKTPTEYSIRINQKGDSFTDFSQDVLVKVANNRITRKTTLKVQDSMIDFKTTVETTYRNYDKFEIAFKHEGPVSDFRTTLSIATPFRSFRTFSTDLTYRGTPSEFTSQLTVNTPFTQLPKLTISLNHRGNPADLSTTLTVTYNDQTITSGVTYKSSRRSIEGTFNLRTPVDGYDNFQVTFNTGFTPAEVTGTATVQTPIEGLEKMSVTGKYSRNLQTMRGSASVESRTKPWSVAFEYNVPSLTDISASARITCPGGTTSAKLTHSGDISSFVSRLEIVTPYTTTTPIAINLAYESTADSFKPKLTVTTPIRGYENFELTASKAGDLRNLQLSAELTTSVRRMRRLATSWSHSYDGTTGINMRGTVETSVPGWERVTGSLTNSGSTDNINTRVSVETSKPGYERFNLALSHTSNRRGVKTTASLETSIPRYNKFAVSSDYSTRSRSSLKWIGSVETPVPGYEKFTANVEHGPSDSGDGFKTSVSATTPVRNYQAFGATISHTGVPSQFQTSLKLTTPSRNMPQIDISLNHRGSTPVDFSTGLTVEYAGKKIDTNVAFALRSSYEETNYEGSFRLESPCPYFRDFAVVAAHNRKMDVKTGKLEVTFNTEKKVDLDYSYSTSGDRNININIRSPTSMSTRLNMDSEGQGSAIINVDERQAVRFDFGYKDVQTSSMTDKAISFKTILPSRTVGFAFGYKINSDKMTSHGELHWDRDTESDFTYDIELATTSRRSQTSYDGKFKVVSGLFNTDSSFSHKMMSSSRYTTDITLQAAETLVIKSDVNLANGFNHVITIQHPRFSKDVTITTEATPTGFKTILSYERYTWNIEGAFSDESRDGALKYATSFRLASGQYFDLQLGADMSADDETRSGGLSVKYLTSRDRKLKNFGLRGEVSRLRQEMKIELETPVDTFRLTTTNRGIDLDNGVISYTVGAESNYFNWRSTIDFSQPDRSLDIKLYKSEDYVQLFGQFVSPTQMTVELNRVNAADRTNCATLSLVLDEERMLTGRAFLRPRLYSELQDFMRLENFVNTRISSDFNALSTTFDYDSRSKYSFFRQSVAMPANSVANYVSSEVSTKLNQVTDAANAMYRANDFYIRDIYNALQRHYDDISRRMQYKMAELRRHYAIWSARVSDRWNELTESLNQAMQDNARRWNEYWQTVAYRWEQIQPNWDALRPYFDDFFDTIKTKLMELFERIRNCDTVRALVDRLTSMQPSDYFLPPSQWQDRLLSYANAIDSWIAEYTAKPELHAVRDWLLNVMQSSKWFYQFLGIEEQVNQWIAEMRTMTWETFKTKVRDYINNYLQLHRTRWTKWDPRTGEYEFQVYIPVDLPDVSTLRRLDPRPIMNQATEWIKNQMPDEELTLLDAINLYKPPSDVRDWVPPFKAHATLTGNQHYMTFDRRFFEFAGECSYLLARDFIGGTFSVIVNYDRPARNQPVKKSLTIVSGGKQIEVFPDGRVTVDAHRVELPVMVANTTVSRTGNMIRVADSFRGVDVTCDLPHDHCTLSVSGWYYGKTAGLLGTYDNEPSNDMTTIDKTQTTRAEDLATGWTVGQRCSSSNRAVAFNSDPETRRYRACADIFREKSSKFRTCFRVVDPEPFLTMCVNDAKTGDNSLEAETDVCRVAAAYMHECRHREVHLRMPKQCVRCEVPEARKVFYDEDEVRLESADEVPRAADVVFVVEHGPCNRDVLPRLVALVDDLDKALKGEGLTATRYSVVGFGGSQHLAGPHVHTMDGQIFNTANKVKIIATNFDYSAGASGSDAMGALRYAARLPFRAGASKTIVLVACDVCRENSTRYNEIQHILLNNDIHLHVLVQDLIKLKSRSPKTAYIFGVEETTVYTRKDVAGDELTGEPDLRRYIRMPKDLCAALTQDSNGAIFSVRQWLDSRPLIQKQFVDVLVRTLARKAIPSSCQVCECMADEAGVGMSQCKSCNRRDPIYSLLPNFDDDDDVEATTTTVSPNVEPDNDVPKGSTVRGGKVTRTPIGRRTVPPRATRRPMARVTRRPVQVPPQPRSFWWW